jgi:biotin carboxyl carrier protein
MKILTALLTAGLFVSACTGSAPEVVATPEPKVTVVVTTTTTVVFTPVAATNDKTTPRSEQYWFGLKFDSPTKIYAPFDGYVVLPDQPVVVGGKRYLVLRLISTQGAGQIELYLGQSRTDAVLLVKSGDRVRAGDEIAKVVGLGPTYISPLSGTGESFQVVGFWRSSSGDYIMMNGDKTELLTSAKAGRVDPP